MSTNNERKTDIAIGEIRASIDDLKSLYIELNNKQIEISTHAKNMATMAVRCSEGNKEDHRAFYTMENNLVELAAKFESHKEEHIMKNQDKRDNKGWYALGVSILMLIYFVCKSAFAHLIHNNSNHN